MLQKEKVIPMGMHILNYIAKANIHENQTARNLK